MIKCLLAKYFSSNGYRAEVFEKATFDIQAMDARWEELFSKPMKDDPKSSWELTECETEPLFEISLKDDLWWWQIGRRLWFNDKYVLIYSEGGSDGTFDGALEVALDAFTNMGTEFEITDLEDIDDDI